jgi:hypothetical protein
MPDIGARTPTPAANSFRKRPVLPRASLRSQGSGLRLLVKSKTREVTVTPCKNQQERPQALPNADLGRLLSHAEPDYAGCCATFGTGGRPLNGSGTFLANGRNQHFALIARDGISGSFDMTQSARRSRRTVGSPFARLASHALWACGTLLAGASLRTGGSGWALRTRRTGGSGWAGRPLWSDDIPGDQALRGPASRTLSDDPDRTAVSVDACENLLSVSAYGRQRQSHDKCSSDSRYSRHDVSIVGVGDEGAR